MNFSNNKQIRGGVSLTRKEGCVTYHNYILYFLLFYYHRNMKQEPDKYDLLWIASEICYYLGLVLAVFLIPGLTFALWAMSAVDKADPNYWYLLIAWVSSLLMFMAGVGLKNFIYSARSNKDGA